MGSESLEAILYDWNNSYRLRNQNADIAFWAERCSRMKSVLVLGAGTGRVASHLVAGRGHGEARASHGEGEAMPRVVALDRDFGRLRRIINHERLDVLAADMRRIPLTGPFDGIVVPYSAFQLLADPSGRRQALSEMARVIGPAGTVWIDVSSRFERRFPTNWQVVLQAECVELRRRIEAWERTETLEDRFVIEKRFLSDDELLLDEVREEWMYESALDLREELPRAGLALLGVDHGYGTVGSEHRRIYAARRT